MLTGSGVNAVVGNQDSNVAYGAYIGTFIEAMRKIVANNATDRLIFVNPLMLKILTPYEQKIVLSFGMTFTVGFVLMNVTCFQAFSRTKNYYDNKFKVEILATLFIKRKKRALLIKLLKTKNNAYIKKSALFYNPKDY